MLLGWSPRKATTWVLVASLALAFAGFATIALLSQYDRHFNASIDPEGTVYQIYTQITRPGEEPQAMAASLPDLAGAITASVPGAKVGRITLSQEAQSVAVDHAASLERIEEADPALADILDLADDPAAIRAVLEEPDGAVVTRDAAQRLFPDEDPVGKTFDFKDHSYRIGAVLRDLPENSSLADVDILVSSIGAWTILGSATKAGAPLMLSVGDMATFVKVPAGELAMLGAVQRAADRQAEVLMRRLLSSAGAQTGGAPSFAHKAVPIRQPDLAVAIGSAPDPRRLDPAKLVVLSILAITVLIAASLNASNLTMSQMLEKAPTIAVRRAFGAGRAQVAQSVLSGGMLLFVIAAIIGCIFAAILSDPFGSILGRPVDSVLDAAGLITIALLAIVIGLASAAYPAFAASRFKTSAVLSSRWANIPGASIIRVVLVALQVGASAAIILFAAAVYQQLSFLTKADLGFNNRSAVAFVLPEPVFPDDPRSSTLRALGGEDESVSLTAVLPSEGSMGRLGLQTSAGQIIEASSASIDPAYFDVLDARLLAGQGFTLTDLGSEDSGAAQPVILSANLTSALGFTSPYEAIGQILRVPDESRTLMIKAVAPNLPLGAIRDQKRPFAVYEPARRPATYLLAPSAEIASDVQRVFPGQPLESIALAQRARNAYLDLTRIRWIAALFALLALITASVGIYALAVNRAANMRVEAGVRKAFGARNWSIALLLLRRLTPAITVGILLGLVAGGVVTLRWLSGFSRQAADLPIAAIIATLAILILFVFASAGQAFRLARSNPVKTLRDTA